MVKRYFIISLEAAISAYQNLNFASEKKKCLSGEQEGIPVHCQRVLRESSEEAAIMNNA